MTRFQLITGYWKVQRNQLAFYVKGVVDMIMDFSVAKEKPQDVSLMLEPCQRAVVFNDLAHMMGNHLSTHDYYILKTQFKELDVKT